MPGAVAIDPLARQRDRAVAFLLKRKWPDRRLMRVALSSRRDRLTAIGRRRSNIAKKEKSYWGARRKGANGKNKFPKSESERVSGKGTTKRSIFWPEPRRL